jgi:hypothetical protein
MRRLSTAPFHKSGFGSRLGLRVIWPTTRAVRANLQYDVETYGACNDRYAAGMTATMTLDQYGHLFPDDLDGVADKMDDLVSGCAQNVPKKETGQGENTP